MICNIAHVTLIVVASCCVSSHSNLICLLLMCMSGERGTERAVLFREEEKGGENENEWRREGDTVTHF